MFFSPHVREGRGALVRSTDQRLVLAVILLAHSLRHVERIPRLEQVVHAKRLVRPAGAARGSGLPGMRHFSKLKYTDEGPVSRKYTN